MVETQIEYIGDLRCKLTHTQSRTVIYTDPPKDNHGKGENFSPTDLLATAYGACFGSILAIAAKERNMDISGFKIKAIKEMSANPRKISKIGLEIKFPKEDYTDKEKHLIEFVIKTCPVRLSLNPDIDFDVKVFYGI